MSNPFDAAIERLRRSETQGCEPDIEAAIRVLEAAGKALEAKDKYIKNGLSEWGNYMTAIGALTEAALRGSSNVGIGSQSADGPGSSPGPRSSPLPAEVEEAMEILRKAVTGYSRGGQTLEDCENSLAVIRAALAKGAGAERRYAELVEDVSRRTDQARTMEVKL